MVVVQAVYPTSASCSGYYWYMDVDDDTPAPKDISAIVRVLGEQNITVTELVTLLLTEKQYKKNSLTRDLIKNAEFMLPHCNGATV